MSEFALVNTPLGNNKLNRTKSIEFLERIVTPDLKFVELCFKEKRNLDPVARLRKSKII